MFQRGVFDYVSVVARICVETDRILILVSYRCDANGHIISCTNAQLHVDEAVFVVFDSCFCGCQATPLSETPGPRRREVWVPGT